MIEFGKTLREAREAKGLSVAQLADQTHIMHQIVEGLENEDFSRIVAPIYGRGFVKLYCEAVGLEPKPLVNEFMEIYNGNRPAAIRTRTVPTAEAAPASKAAAPDPDIPRDELAEKADDDMGLPPATDLFGEPVKPVEMPPRRASYAPPTPEPPADPQVPKTPSSRFAAPPPEDRAPIFHHDFVGELGKRLPPNTWRILTLALGTLVLLALLAWAINTIYRAATTVPATDTAKPPAVKAQTVPAPTKATTEMEAPQPTKTARKPASVPALYID